MLPRSTRRAGWRKRLGSGTTSISATFTNPDGTAAQGTATLTVTTTTGSPEPLTAMTVAPNAQTALAIGQTAQFLAIATTNTGTSVNLTNQGATVDGKAINPATWTSSNPSVATVDPATGIARSVGAGAAVITAIAYNPDGSVVTGAATYTVSVSTSTSSEPLVSLAIVPNCADGDWRWTKPLGFLAIGTTGRHHGEPDQSIGDDRFGNDQRGCVEFQQPVSGHYRSGHWNCHGGQRGHDRNHGHCRQSGRHRGDGKQPLLTVTFPPPEPLVSLAIVPASQTLTAANQTAGLIAIGTTTTGTTVNLTNMPATIGAATIKAAAWSSSVPSVATINPARRCHGVMQRHDGHHGDGRQSRRHGGDGNRDLDREHPRHAGAAGVAGHRSGLADADGSQSDRRADRHRDHIQRHDGEPDRCTGNDRHGDDQGDHVELPVFPRWPRSTLPPEVSRPSPTASRRSRPWPSIQTERW